MRHIVRGSLNLNLNSTLSQKSPLSLPNSLPRERREQPTKEKPNLKYNTDRPPRSSQISSRISNINRTNGQHPPRANKSLLPAEADSSLARRILRRRGAFDAAAREISTRGRACKWYKLAGSFIGLSAGAGRAILNLAWLAGRRKLARWLAGNSVELAGAPLECLLPRAVLDCFGLEFNFASWRKHLYGFLACML